MIPAGYNLAQNYPNPFNATTTIAFQIPTASDVTLEIYNMLGQLQRTLVDDHLSAGDYTISVDAAGWSNGIYIYRLKAAPFIDTRKMVVLK